MTLLGTCIYNVESSRKIWSDFNGLLQIRVYRLTQIEQYFEVFEKFEIVHFIHYTLQHKFKYWNIVQFM